MFLPVATDEGKRKNGLTVVVLVLEEGVDFRPHRITKRILFLLFLHIALHEELLQVFGVDVDNLPCRIAVFLGDTAALHDSRKIAVHIAHKDALPCRLRIIRMPCRRIVGRKNEVSRSLGLRLSVGILRSRIGADAVVLNLRFERGKRTVCIESRNSRNGEIAVLIVHGVVQPLVAHIHIVDAVLLVHSFQTASKGTVVVDTDDFRLPSGIVLVLVLQVELQFRETDAEVREIVGQFRIHQVEVAVLGEFLNAEGGKLPFLESLFQVGHFLTKLFFHLLAEFALSVVDGRKEIHKLLTLLEKLAFDKLLGC